MFIVEKNSCQQTGNIYAASCTENGGIFHYQVIHNEFILKNITQMDRPMYMVILDGKMYIGLRSPFESKESGVIVYDIAEDGTLVNPSEIMSTKGSVK